MAWDTPEQKPPFEFDQEEADKELDSKTLEDERAAFAEELTGGLSRVKGEELGSKLGGDTETVFDSSKDNK